MKFNTFPSNKKAKAAILGSGIALAVLLLAFLVIHIVRVITAPEIPASIQQRADFQIYVPPKNGTIWSVQKNLVTYNGQSGILSVTAVSSANSLAISEQQTPSIFTNIPQYYPTLLSKLNEYDQIQTSLGTVGLTKPTELHGQQTAVLNSGGTLVFVRPQHNLTHAQWSSFFNEMIVIK